MAEAKSLKDLMRIRVHNREFLDSINDGLGTALEGGQAEVGKEVEPAVDELVERLRGWDDQVWAGSQIAHWVDQNLI